MFITDSYWIPMILCGDDLPGAMSISKIAKYIILPLADWKISILAISMYQCDYILVCHHYILLFYYFLMNKIF